MASQWIVDRFVYYGIKSKFLLLIGDVTLDLREDYIFDLTSTLLTNEFLNRVDLKSSGVTALGHELACFRVEMLL